MQCPWFSYCSGDPILPMLPMFSVRFFLRFLVNELAETAYFLGRMFLAMLHVLGLLALFFRLVVGKFAQRFYGFL